MLAPASRFSKSERTGTRDPRKTQAPLSLSGDRSTSEHCDQSSIAPIIAPITIPDQGAGTGSAPTLGRTGHLPASLR